MVANALIFDLDGTILDSAGWFASTLADDNPTSTILIRDNLERGSNITKLIKDSHQTYSQFIKKAQKCYGPPPIFDGMLETIKELNKGGTALAVVTSLPGSLALPMLEACNLKKFFPVVVHAGICRISKPNPSSIMKALEMLKRTPTKQIFYVGDRATDVQAAERAGISSAWVRHGYEQPKHINQH